MKKLIAFFLAAVLAGLTLCACTPVEKPIVPEPDDSVWTNPYDGIKIEEYIELGTYKNFTVSVEKEKITEELLDYYVTYYYAESFTTEETDRVTVENGDTVSIVYTPYVDEEAIDGETDLEDVIVIGYSQMIDGFEEGIIGKNVGDKFVLNLMFPEDYTTTEKYAYLNGKPVLFEIEIKSLSSTVIPTKEEFAKEKGYDSFEEYREDLRGSLENFAENEYRSSFSDEVIKTIVENCTKLEIPQSVYDNYINEFRKTYSEYAAYYGDSYTWETIFESYYGTTPDEYVKNQIHRELVMLSVYDAEDLKITDEFYASEIKMLQEYLQSSYYTAYSEEDIVEMFGREYLDYQFNLDYTLEWIEKTVTNDAAE